ncbi:hypothetical protein [Streptomyces peucetius]|uniref:Guanylate cyclase domain-containing protein n=1 Tax=Streptomyces peucetius TaxID=1950 RepID=A0ABY6ICR4_STRPE|nr:hypothetical protein [Streptomyces peucetius]UYQ63754.1 hypothetical protein OGH68_21355 [Streptomyces peucetius]
MRPKSQYYSILVVDIAEFGSRANPLQLWLRERLYTLTESAFTEAGVDHRSTPRPSDRGDGFFWLLPGTVDRTDLTGRFVEVLNHRLREHARTSSEEGALRLRVALHQGDVAGDGRGWAGEELNTACRLVDIAPLRTALASGTRAGLALAVSADWHRQIVRHDDPSVASETFRRVPFDAKEIQGASAWIRVPGYDAPPGLTEAETAPPAGPAAPSGRAAPGPVAAGRTAPGPDTAPNRSGADGSGPFAGAVFDRVGQVFAGDQVVHGTQHFRWSAEPDDPEDPDRRPKAGA